MLEQQIKFDAFSARLKGLISNLYTGKVIFLSSQNEFWTIYFRLGRLIWVEERGEAKEKWQRHLKYYCPQLPESEISIEKTAEKYHFLAQLYQKQKILNKDQVSEIVRSIAEEVLFDIMQCQGQEDTIVSQEFPNEIPNILLGLIQPDPLLNSVKADWQKWVDSGLVFYSPNSYPVVETNKATLENIKSPILAKIKGQKTLRELAWETNRDLLNLTNEVVELVQQEVVALYPEPQIQPEIKIEKDDAFISQENIGNGKVRKKLIACLDDSVGVCEKLKELLTASGYEVITFQQPATAMSQLIKQKPDLILLDLMMPMISGYEVCTQLRRVPSFKQTPIIILTGKDGWVDRARATMCGATNFLSKPVQKVKLFETINKHLFVNTEL
ncbi:MAG: response regulator [Halothece sp.]